jgi:hypothetical protein
MGEYLIEPAQAPKRKKQGQAAQQGQHTQVAAPPTAEDRQPDDGNSQIEALRPKVVRIEKTERPFLEHVVEGLFGRRIVREGLFPDRSGQDSEQA